MKGGEKETPISLLRGTFQNGRILRLALGVFEICIVSKEAHDVDGLV